MGVRTARLNPDDGRLAHLPLETLGAAREARLVVTSEGLYECFTHFVGGRTLPCLEEECAACGDRRPARYEAFLSAVWSGRKGHFIVRLTENAAADLLRAIPRPGSMRCHCVTLMRHGKRANGKLTATVETTPYEGSRLPAAPDLALHLSRIWRLEGLEVAGVPRLYVDQLKSLVDLCNEKGGSENAA